jgi:hypothetical protein
LSNPKRTRAVLENIFNGQARLRLQNPSDAEIRQQLLNPPEESVPEEQSIPWCIVIRRSENSFMAANGDEQHGFRVSHRELSAAGDWECRDHSLSLDKVVAVLSSYADDDERWHTLVRWERRIEKSPREPLFLDSPCATCVGSIQERKIKPAAYLYIFRECGFPFYKIGVASEPTARLRQLQTGNSTSIEMAGAWPFETREAAKLVEGRIHLRHRVARREGGTEWFHLDDDEIDQLKADLQANAWREAIEWDQSYWIVRKVMPWVVGAGVVLWTIGRETVRFIMNRRKA